MGVAEAIRETLISPNVSDSNWEAANVVDVLASLASGSHRIASAITPKDAAPGTDAARGSVSSLAEAVMGVTAGLFAVAEAIDRLSESVGPHGE